MPPSVPWPERVSRLAFAGLLPVVLFFGLLAGMPDSVWDGFMTGLFPKLRPEHPRLVLESFGHERLPGELRLHIQVRNASTAPLEKVQAVITIYDTTGKQLNTLVYPVEPPLLPPGQSVPVAISFPESNPASQYAVFFKTASGEVIPHSQFY